MLYIYSRSIKTKYMPPIDWRLVISCIFSLFRFRLSCQTIFLFLKKNFPLILDRTRRFDGAFAGWYTGDLLTRRQTGRFNLRKIWWADTVKSPAVLIGFCVHVDAASSQSKSLPPPYISTVLLASYRPYNFFFVLFAFRIEFGVGLKTTSKRKNNIVCVCVLLLIFYYHDYVLFVFCFSTHFVRACVCVVLCLIPPLKQWRRTHIEKRPHSSPLAATNL